MKTWRRPYKCGILRGLLEIKERFVLAEIMV